VSDELEQVRAINRALPFAEGIAQGNTLWRDHLEASFMDYGYYLGRTKRGADGSVDSLIEAAVLHNNLTFAQLANALWGPL